MQVWSQPNRIRAYCAACASPTKLPSSLEPARSQPVALVFGSEVRGLTTEQVKRCQMIATILTDASHTSLNLAAAVQLMHESTGQFDPALMQAFTRVAGHFGRIFREVPG